VTRFTAATVRFWFRRNDFTKVTFLLCCASRQDVPAAQKKRREWAPLQASEPAARPNLGDDARAKHVLESLVPEMIRRRSFLALAAAAVASSQASAVAGGNDIFHVAIFRFAKENVNDAFRALATASRQEPGNLSYDIYRGIDDDQEFYVVEHWASPTALAAHERTEAFIHFGQDVLVRHATLHDTVTGRAFV
jgi:quinol monooxygenase YgiN